jgi:hypothetical protein
MKSEDKSQGKFGDFDENLKKQNIVWAVMEGEQGEAVSPVQDFNPGYRKTTPGVAGEDRREEPRKNQRGRRDLPDAEMRLVRELDGNTD